MLLVVADGPGRRLCVELVCVVQDGGLGGASGLAVVMARDRMEKLGQGGRVEIGRALLDHPQPEVDMSEQASFLGLDESRPGTELANTAHVVEQRAREQEVGAKPGMQLGRLTAKRRDPDRMLEQPSGVAVVTVDSSRRKRAKARADLRIPYEGFHELGETWMSNLGGEELEEAVQLVGISPQDGRQRGGVGLLGRLECAYLELQLAAEALHAAQHSHRVPLVEARVEKLDVAPDPSLDPAGRVGELECKVRSPSSSSATFLLRDREHRVDGPVLGELGNRGHGLSVRTQHVGTLAAMADVQPFRAVRYSGAAGALADLVAPPYDAVSDEERERLYTRSPFNVVHVTLPDSPDDAARLYRSLLSDGVLERDEDTAAWFLLEKYVGPDGVARERRGLVASVAAEPYSTGAVLPHERTHPRIREERLRLLRAIEVHPEPIFLLVDRPLTLDLPAGPADVAVDGTQLWRLSKIDADALVGGAQLLIADGHHRYESTLELGAERATPRPRIMALLVSTEDPGLHVFPTHRIFRDRPDLRDARDGDACADLEEALVRLADEPFARSAAVVYRACHVELVHGLEGELDVELVDRHGLDGIAYTSRREEAASAVDRGEADVAFILRGPRVADVFAAARRGERMPPKSTYFFPKPLSGLLFHPVEP
ncbi:hypothetical protein BH09ACT13_BH09ACT13_14120 [soil metagenome]